MEKRENFILTVRNVCLKSKVCCKFVREETCDVAGDTGLTEVRQETRVIEQDTEKNLLTKAAGLAL